MDALVTWLLNNYPWLVLVVIAIVVTWKVSKYHSKLEETNDKVKALPCEEHSRQLKNFAALDSLVQVLNNNLVEINKRIIKDDPGATDVFLDLMKKHSPLQMTPMGKNLFEITPAKKTMDDNLEFFIGQLEQINPKTAYDVEDKALNVLLSNTNNDIFQALKHYIYYAPEYLPMKTDTGEEKQVKLSLTVLLQLMSVYLRDKFLEKYPEIK